MAVSIVFAVNEVNFCSLLTVNRTLLVILFNDVTIKIKIVG